MAQRVHFPTSASCAYANESERSGSMSIADLVNDGISSVGKVGGRRGWSWDAPGRERNVVIRGTLQQSAPYGVR